MSVSFCYLDVIQEDYDGFSDPAISPMICLARRINWIVSRESYLEFYSSRLLFIRLGWDISRIATLLCRITGFSGRAFHTLNRYRSRLDSSVFNHTTF